MCSDLLAGMDPRAKLAAFLAVQALLFMPCTQPPPARLAAVAVPLFLLLPWAGGSCRLWLRTLAMAAPLLALLAVSAFLSPAASGQAARLALLMLAKSVLVFLALALFILNEDARRLLQGLRQVGLPRTAAVVMTIGYRFAGQMRLELGRMHQAWIGRNFNSLSRLQRARSLGSFMPLFFERLLDSSVHIHDAMVSRGFDGTLPPWQRLHYSGRDAVFLGFVALTTAAIAAL